MKRWTPLMFLVVVPALWALDVPKPEDLGNPAFVKGFDAFSSTVKPSAGGPLLSREEAVKFVNDLLVIARNGTGLSPDLLRHLELTSTVFAANPYSLTAGVAFHQAFSSLFIAQQLGLATAPVQGNAEEVVRKVSYLNGMRGRLEDHVNGLARAVDWEHARAKFPGGAKKFDQALTPKKAK